MRFGPLVMRSRRFQFGMRALLVILSIACVMFAILGARVAAAKRQLRAIRAIERLGGQVWFQWAEGSMKVPLGDPMFADRPALRLHAKLVDPSTSIWTWFRYSFRDDFPPPVRAVDFRGGVVLPESVLAQLLDLRGLTHVALERVEVTRDGLAQVASVPDLLHLGIYNCEIDNEDLLVFARAKKLKRIDLCDVPIDGSGLGCLRDLPDLACLDLQGSGVTDAGIQCIKDLKQLRCLDLSQTQISDRTIATLGMLEWLELVDVVDAETVSLDACQELRRRRPELSVRRGSSVSGETRWEIFGPDRDVTDYLVDPDQEQD